MSWEFELLLLGKLIGNSNSNSRVTKGNKSGIRIRGHSGKMKWEFKFDSNLRESGEHELGIELENKFKLEEGRGEMS